MTGPERDRMLAQVYDELRIVARRVLAHDRMAARLHPTELVNVAAIRIMGHDRLSPRGRTQFVAFSAHVMRQVLIDEVRRFRAAKRDAPQVTLVTAISDSAAPEDPGIDAEAVHDALGRLAEVDGALSRLVELRYFGGLTLEEIAELDGVSVSTLKRQWRVARAWLQDALGA